MRYEGLLKEAVSLGVYVLEKPLKGRIKGLYSDNVILISKNLTSDIEKYCVLAEELGHHHTTDGDILDQTSVDNRKQELRARSWAYERAVPLKKIVEAHKESIRNKYELADFLGVTEAFLEEALVRYQDKYGETTNYEGFTICFNPLGVIEWFDDSYCKIF